MIAVKRVARSKQLNGVDYGNGPLRTARFFG